MRFRPLLMQLLIGMSMRRYLPATGTAGLLRSLVSGYSRVPRPPPRIRLRTSRCIVHRTLGDHKWRDLHIVCQASGAGEEDSGGRGIVEARYGYHRIARTSILFGETEAY